MTAAPQESEPTSARSTRPGTQRVVARIGDILCTATTVSTSSGVAPIGEVQWRIKDATTVRARAMDGLLRRRVDGLLDGEVHVTATAEDWQHTATIPVRSLAEVTEIYAGVLRVRGLQQRS